jgi:hypothetical protein
MERNTYLLYLALFTPGINAVAWYSGAGRGKSKMWRHVMEHLGSKVNIRHSAPAHDTADWAGYPSPGEDGMLRMIAPHCFHLLNDAAKRDGISAYLIDEVGDLTRDKQAALLMPLDEKTVGETVLDDEVKITICLNQPEFSTDAQEQAGPFANRIVWLPFDLVEKPNHGSYMRLTAMRQKPTMPVLPKLDKAEWWTVWFPRAAAIYEKWMDQTISVLEENANDPEVKQRWPLAFASCRTNEMAVRMLATCLMVNDLPAARILLSGTIGKPCAEPLVSYAEKMDLIDPEEYLANDEGIRLFKPDVKRPDRTYAQMMAIAVTACAPHKDAIKRWHRAWRGIALTLELVKGADHLCLIAGQHLAANKPKGTLLPDVLPVIQRLAPMTAAKLALASMSETD